MGKGALLVWTLLVLTATHWPNPNIDLDPLGGDKTVHFVAYGIWGALAVRGWARSFRQAAGAASLGGMLAALDEVTQPFFGRHADTADWMADLLGLLIGVAMALWWRDGRQSLRR